VYGIGRYKRPLSVPWWSGKSLDQGEFLNWMFLKADEMNKFRMTLFVCGLIIFGCLPDVRGAQNSELPPEKEILLLQSKKTWSAFECSYLASKLNKPNEQERLFLFGFDMGKSFLIAAEQRKFTREEASKIVPTGFLLVMQGPSHDFVLGRLWESITEYASKELFRKLEGQIYTDERIKFLAETEYANQNCELIGR